MNEIVVNLLLNSVMAALLIVTIVYCFKLNSRIRILQDSKNEFSKLIEQFDATTGRAQKSIEELQNISRKVNEQLSGKLDKANFLADDLAFMIERGTKLADKIDGGTHARKPARAGGFDSLEEREEIRPGRKRSDGAAPTPASAGEEKRERKQALEAVLNKMSGNNKEAPKASPLKKPARSGPTARLRSKAEQELYDALKSGGGN